MNATDAYEGYREFVLARGAALSRAAYLLTGDRSAAQELTQAALVKAALRWRRVVAAGDPEASPSGRAISSSDHSAAAARKAWHSAAAGSGRFREAAG